MSEKRDGCGTALYVTYTQLPSFSIALTISLCIRQPGYTCSLHLHAYKQQSSVCKLHLGPRSSFLSGYVVCFDPPSLSDIPHSQLADSQGYDYHPPLPDTEAGPLGDCAICMDAIERPPEDVSGKSSRRGAGARASYSLAPCSHLFVSLFSWNFKAWRTLSPFISVQQHTECLERVRFVLPLV
jgi:hypothetical protein